jgi:aldehyde oxidoreductase
VNSMPQCIRLKINHQTHVVTIPGNVPEKTNLLTYLRDHLNLTGAKNGCSQRGECGACTVIVNGKAQRSCLLLLERLDGASIETIEGLAQGENLHPLQWAFAEEGAIECGFCTPGTILASKALLDKNPHPSGEEVIQALSGHLCRCGMYQPMVAAVLKASQTLGDEEAFRPILRPKNLSGIPVGFPLPRLDAEEKVMGKSIYGQDLNFGDMLFAVPVLPECVHGEIFSIDLGEALRMPGVVTILTAKDVPGFPFRGVVTPDWPLFSKDRVRFTGDVVALVIAGSLAQARAAAGKVSIEYRPLPVVSDPEAALSESSPQLHAGGNLCSRERIVRGDVRRGLQQADLIIDQTYTTQCTEHAYLETEAGVANFSEAGVVVHVGGHDSESNRMEIARALNLPTEKVRIVRPTLGGSFGAKRDISIQIYLALGSMKTGRPVKMVLTRQESFRMSTKRHSAKMRYVTGFSKKGRITASRMEITMDAGAYSSETVPVLKLAVGHCTGPYVIPNLEVVGKAVFTNNPIGGAMRGYGFPQVNFAMESQLDIAARELGLDPIQIRRINAITKGGRTSCGQRVDTDVSLVECLERAYKRAVDVAPQPAEGWKVGIGLAGLWKTSAISHGRDPGAKVHLELNPDGKVFVRVNCHELGQGTTTGLAQIVSHELELTLDRIRVISNDTFLTPEGGPAIASRQTFVLGTAVLRAARQLKQKILGFLESDTGSIPWDHKEKMGLLKEMRVEASYYHQFPEAVAIPEKEEDVKDLRFDQSLTYGAHAAIVKVEESTGRIVVDRIIAVHDVGKVINPLLCRSQIIGGVLMGLGQAMNEDLDLREGKISHDSLLSYGIPRVDLVGTIEAIMVEHEDPLGPFGAKGVAEAPTLPVAAAVANAIHGATGVRLNSLPLQLEGTEKRR